jgi:hypothetical protein
MSHLLLHALAVQPLPATTAASQVSATVGASMARAAASVGQYVLPCFFLFGAAVSAVGRHRRKALIDDARVPALHRPSREWPGGSSKC